MQDESVVVYQTKDAFQAEIARLVLCIKNVPAKIATRVPLRRDRAPELHDLLVAPADAAAARAILDREGYVGAAD